MNKVASKVELRVDPHAITGLSDRARSRLLTKTAGRRDADGWIIVVSQRTRDQHRNLEDARQKVRELIVAAFVEPKRRRKTSRASPRASAGCPRRSARGSASCTAAAAPTTRRGYFAWARMSASRAVMSPRRPLMAPSNSSLLNGFFVSLRAALRIWL